MEGVIKYNLEWEEAPPSHSCPEITELDDLRTRLYEGGYLGVNSEGLGQGNVSRILTRDGNSFTFLITGSQTGGLPALAPRHYVTVTGYDFESFTLRARGPVKPSSESLTHCAVYEIHPEISWVAHIHEDELWKYMCETWRLSTDRAEYGTPRMVREIRELYASLPREELFSNNILVMKNHEGGILSFGRTAEEAFQAIRRAHDMYEESRS